MKKDFTKLYDSSLVIRGQYQAQGKSGNWHNARPEPYRNIFYRIRDSWNVLFGKADALYWMIDSDN